MSRIRPLAGLSLLVLCNCSLLSRGTSQLGSKSPSVPGSASSAAARSSAPRVKPDRDDPPHVTRAIERLDAMEKMIADRDFAHYARESRDFQGTFLFHDGWAGEKKRDAIKARLDALDARAFQAFGGRLTVVGDARRVLKIDGDAAEAAGVALDACRTATATRTTGTGEASGALAKAISAYEKALARAVKADPMTVHFFGEVGKYGTADVPTLLLECEVQLAAMSAQFADEYTPETAPTTEYETACGVVDWVAAGVQIGAGKFAPYSRSKGGASSPERLACNKLPARGNANAGFSDAIQDLSQYLDIPAAKLVITVDGPPSIEVNDEDLHTYRYQKLRAYSRQYKFAKNPCGGARVFCEAGGSRAATAYNKLEHALDRAAVHAGKAPDACKAQLKDAKAHAAWFEEFHADAVKSGEWVAGATYKTKKGDKLTEQALIAAFADKAKLADDHLLDKYCTRPAT